MHVRIETFLIIMSTVQKGFWVFDAAGIKILPGFGKNGGNVCKRVCDRPASREDGC